IPAHNDGLINDYIHTIATAPDGTIWAGTMTGVSKYDGDTWISYTVDNGLANNHVTSIACGSEGEVWIGSDQGGGVSHYNGETWTTFTTDDGLGHNSISALAVGPDNTVWIGSAGGLQHYIPETGTFVNETDILPEEIKIISNYPNPFNPETTIEFTLPSESAVDLSIYNITGQKVRTIVSESMIAGIHSIRWDGTSESGQTLSSGVYIARITMGEKVAARSMMLMK
ncbi:MAG: T9SS type A sorting domain-containing protein, partial [Candidatus Latescibacteria bacterium]|nr:T9SS type A sorting domain-containing protein [Candidatus Latescibacterota bacterium]